MNNGGAAGAEHGAPLGTEYTLQGVMRFLQMEWHNHERRRNAWDIEREEMKQKISAQEGKIRGLKHSNSVLEKCVKVLEKALRDERAKNKALKTLQSGESMGAEQKEGLEKIASRPDVRNGFNGLDQPRSSFLDIESATTEAEKDAQLEKSRKYLTKCVEEITYLLLPPSHPPPPQLSHQSLNDSSTYMSHAELPMTMEEAVLQQRQKNQAQQPISSMSQALNNNNHPLPNPSLSDVSQMAQASRQAPQHSDFMARELAMQPPFPHEQMLSNSVFPTAAEMQTQPFPAATQDDPTAKLPHTLETIGRTAGRGDEEQISLSNHGGGNSQDLSEGFVFDDPTQLQESNPELQPPRRPDQDMFPSADRIPVRSPPRTGPGSHRRKSSGSMAMARRRSQDSEAKEAAAQALKAQDPQQFKVRFALRGHLDVVRSVIFTGGGSPSEPEICTAGDDGMIKRWIIPASYGSFPQQTGGGSGGGSGAAGGGGDDLDIQSYFTHRGHEGVVTSLAACPATSSFSTGGRVSGDGWIFSGGQDATIRVWERGRVDPKATLEGHTDAVWAVCMLPATNSSTFGTGRNHFGGPDRVLLASGSADGTVKIWAVSAPPQIAQPPTGSRRGVGGSRRHSVTSGSNYPSSPQPSIATSTPFHYTLVHSIERAGLPSPTCISPLSPTGETFVVSYNDASILIFDTRTGEEIIGMASNETYDGTPATAVNTIVATALGSESSLAFASMGAGLDPSTRGLLGAEDETTVHAATGSNTDGGVEGVVISGHEDQFIRFFDANSGQCTYSMLAHPSAISSLSLSRDGREAVSAGHDASIRFWNLEKRVCTQMISSHRIMRGEGVCAVTWSPDGRLVVSGGGDSVVKVFAR